MRLDTARLRLGLDRVAATEPAIARALTLAGYPEPRIRPAGHITLLRAIVGQQVSVAAAASIWAKLEALLGEGIAPEALLAAGEGDLRACGLSRQKQSYARSLSELVVNGEVDLHRLPADDEAAIALLTRIKGIGRWSAEIYLLFAEARPDIWPAGDLAVQAAVGRIMGLPERPSEKDLRQIAEPWTPDRGAVALLAWYCYRAAL